MKSIIKILILNHIKRNTKLKKLGLEIKPKFSNFIAARLPIFNRILCSRYLKLCSKLNFTHIMVFSEKGMNIFFKIFKIPHKWIITFRLIKFSTRKELFFSNKNEDVISATNKNLLLLNGFSFNNTISADLYSIIHELIPGKYTQRCFLKNAFEIIFFDFSLNNTLVDVRFYHVTGISTAINRKIRKKKINQNHLKGKLTEISGKFRNNCEFCKINNKVDNLCKKYFIRIIEIGPRVTLNFLEMTKNS